MTRTRRCPLCGGLDHEDLTLCPAFAGADEDGGGGPIQFGMDPYTMFDPQVQMQMQQLAAQNQTNEVMARLLAITEEQAKEIKILRAEVKRLPGRAARALPPPPKFCTYCGGELAHCKPVCRVTGERNG